MRRNCILHSPTWPKFSWTFTGISFRRVSFCKMRTSRDSWDKKKNKKRQNEMMVRLFAREARHSHDLVKTHTSFEVYNWYNILFRMASKLVPNVNRTNAKMVKAQQRATRKKNMPNRRTSLDRCTNTWILTIVALFAGRAAFTRAALSLSEQNLSLILSRLF